MLDSPPKARVGEEAEEEEEEAAAAVAVAAAHLQAVQHLADVVAAGLGEELPSVQLHLEPLAPRHFHGALRDLIVSFVRSRSSDR